MCLGANELACATTRRCMQCPLDRDAYHSFRSKTTMLLLAIVDATGKFTYANVGSPGNCGDLGVWNRSRFRRKRVNEQSLLRVCAGVLHGCWPRYRSDDHAFPRE